MADIERQELKVRETARKAKSQRQAVEYAKRRAGELSN